MNLYDAEPPEKDIGTGFMGQHSGDFGDTEWHSTPHLELAEYYASPTSLRNVQSIVTSVSVGESMCVYSRKHGTRTCDRVHRTSVSTSTSRRMFATENGSTVGGDSVHPWGYNIKSYGTRSGEISIDGNGRNIWSRVSLANRVRRVRPKSSLGK